MASSNNSEIISKASPHTIKKFELIEEYIKSWAQKLMLTDFCNGLIYIDCMCNSGMYYDENGELVEGTPVRVANALRDVAGQYPRKQIYIYFNDNSAGKIAELEKHLPKGKGNYIIKTSVGDGNAFLKNIGPQLNEGNHLHFFLLYDPYDASIDWAALAPFFRHWGEVLINHMISDPIRALSQVKTDKAKRKYMDTYLIDDVEKLLPYGSDKAAYEKRLEKIITALKGSPNRRYYIAAFPFFNTRNALLYDLVHCTSHEAGFKLFKRTAWKTFGDKSSLKNRHGAETQMILDFSGEGGITTEVDDYCYNVRNIASYVQNLFRGQTDVPLEQIWTVLDEHPVFPSEGYKPKIKAALKSEFSAQASKSTITFMDRRG